MKNSTRLWLSLIIVVVLSNFAAAQTSLGSSKTFMNNLKKELTSKKFSIKADNSKSFKAKINYKESSASSIFLIGEIKGIPESSFFIRIKNNIVEGHIILKKTKKAYKYFSDVQGNAFVSKVDIDTLICIGYPNIPENTNKTTNKTTATAISQAVLNLQSLPGAAGCILLDYDGYYMPAGNIWNSGNPIDAAPSGMSDADIQHNWEIVAEDYRPFNLNVTTSEAVFNTYPKNRRMRAVITPTDTASSGFGGVAYVGSFSWDSDAPCWIFMISGKICANATSHEIGHTLGLAHDGRTNPVEPYFYGIPNTSWAPIMGVGYYNPVVQWSKGEYNYANEKQDDLAIIASQFGIGYRVDDYGNNIATADYLDYSANGAINQKNGVISSEADSDFFSFNTGGGNISINANTMPIDGILHLMIKLYNSAGVEMGTYWNPDPYVLNASLNVNLPKGNYFISIKGTGAGDAGYGGYSAYSSIGSYSITGTIPPGGTIPPSTNVVTVYKDFNYDGFSGGLTIGDYDTKRLNSLGFLDDDISSLKVAQGFQAILYQNDNFTGASIVITSDNAGLNAAWNDKTSSVRILANGVTTLDNKTFFLQNKNSGLNMVVWDASLENGANIAQGASNDGNNQKFTFAHLGDGLYQIIASHSGQSLDVDNYSTNNGANVRQYPYSAGANQQFIVVAAGDGFYKIIARHSGKVVDVAGASTANGANVQQWENLNQTNGQWKLTPTTVTEISTLIQAEDYSSMEGGITKELTTDVGGGLNVTNTKIGDLLSYDKINFPSAGTYLIEYRVATAVDQAKIFTDLNDQAIFIGNVNVPNTGGWQNWQTVKQTVTVNSGLYKLGIYIQNKSTNINWIRISKIEPNTTALIQAEDYSSMRGITTEATTDFGGGLNITNTNSVNWAGYSNINFPTTGFYLIEYRVASAVDGAQVNADLNFGDFFDLVNIPNTGGWQKWQTVQQTVYVAARTYNLRIDIHNEKANINWIKISKIGAASAASTITTERTASVDLNIYPNPVANTLFITTDLTGGNISIVDSQTGTVVSGQKVYNNSIDVSGLNRGVYFIVLEKDGIKTIKRFIKK